MVFLGILLNNRSQIKASPSLINTIKSVLREFDINNNKYTLYIYLNA